MIRFRQTILKDVPRLFYHTTKGIVTFPHRAIVTAINFNRRLGIKQSEYDWFESDKKLISSYKVGNDKKFDSEEPAKSEKIVTSESIFDQKWLVYDPDDKLTF